MVTYLLFSDMYKDSFDIYLSHNGWIIIMCVCIYLVMTTTAAV